nr:RNA-directed DNA polymerase, eukaryota, reverse transcriptase zinc-binding domain protein [Tanacetum cinerariifolium]
MESIRSHFFNGSYPHAKKPTWVKWTNVLVSKYKGGLGISSLYALNRALMFKWVRRFLSQNSSLWANVIKSIHGYHGKIGKQVKASYPSIWLDIVKELSHNNLAFSFRRDPRGGVEQEQFESLMVNVEGTTLVNMRDRLVWSLNSSRDFFVASARKMIEEFMLSEVASRTRWIKVVPIKVNVLAWKIKLDYLPTRLNISHRGMDIDSILCSMCGKAPESTRHVFFNCHIARDILCMTTSWWDIMYMEISSYEEWLD